MEITLVLHFYLGHHEKYSLGLICILKLLVKWSSGVGVAALVCVKATGADDIYLQLCLGVWLKQYAETALGSDSQQLLPPNPVYLSLPQRQLPDFRNGEKSCPLCNFRINCWDFWLRLVIKVKHCASLMRFQAV